MKTHLTLINNSNHSQKAVTLIDETSDVLKIAKNKLRLPRASRLFGLGGEEFNRNSSSSIVYVSCGEPYQGPERRRSGLVKIIGKESEIDTGAREELNHVAGLPGVVAVYGMPDLHAGPTGCAVVSQDCIYPHLAGSDIGCGIALFKAGKLGNFSVDRMKKCLSGIEPLGRCKIRAILDRNCMEECPEDEQLGTIGAGNHFGEFMVIERVYDGVKLGGLGVSENDVVLCVHSGSRQLGKKIFDTFGSRSIPEDNLQFYMDRHDHAVKWAKINRHTIASRILSQEDPEFVLDITHNSISRVYQGSPPKEISLKQWVHRKGAAPSCMGPLIIPGSRGTWSYLVDPRESADMMECGSSLAHGAGRRLTRSQAYQRSIKRYGNKLDGLREIKVGSARDGGLSYVVSGDTRVLAEEIPEAYKDIDAVISDLSPYITLIARLKPVLTVKDI